MQYKHAVHTQYYKSTVISFIFKFSECFRVNFTQSNSTDADGEAEKFSIDSSLCWASCFKADNNYHKKFLEIIQKLQEEQALKNTKGTCFVIDGSVSRLVIFDIIKDYTEYIRF